MKHKFICLMLAALFALSVFAGCAPAEETPAAVPEEPPADVPSTEADKVLFDYSGIDMSGKEHKILDLCAEYDITMVNFWATWCGPCVNEMPGLQSLYETQKENGIGVIGIWLDPENSEDKDAVLQGAGTTYPILIFNEAMAETVNLQAIPVSIFLDSNGYMIGDAVVGAHSEREWLSEITSRLSTLEDR